MLLSALLEEVNDGMVIVVDSAGAQLRIRRILIYLVSKRGFRLNFHVGCGGPSDRFRGQGQLWGNYGVGSTSSHREVTVVVAGWSLLQSVIGTGQRRRRWTTFEGN